MYVREQKIITLTCLARHQVSFRYTTTTELTRMYHGPEKIPQPSCNCCPSCDCCNSLCEGFIYHGGHKFELSDESKEPDVCFSPRHSWFHPKSFSPELRSLFQKHFGKKFTPEQCVTKYISMKKNVKTMDQCDTMTYIWTSHSRQNPMKQHPSVFERSRRDEVCLGFFVNTQHTVTWR